jgi:hypothetical protein
MLTASLKKKMDVQRARDKKIAAVAQAAAARADTGRTDTTRKAAPKLTIVAKTAKRAAPTKKAKKVSGASSKRKRG